MVGSAAIKQGRSANRKHTYFFFFGLSNMPPTGLQIRVRIGKLFSLFLIQNICCGYSKEPSR